MNKFILPGFLIVLALGIFFTYTNKQYAKVKDLRTVNAAYEKAIADSVELIKKRDQVVNAYNSISEEDRLRLERILPDHVDSIRLINDVKSLLARRGVTLKDVKTGSAKAIVGKETTAKTNPSAEIVSDQPAEEVEGDTVKSETLTFKFTTTYDNFSEILRDLQSSLRIIEVSHIKFTSKDKDNGQYDFEVEVRTFWLKFKQ
jgi:Tfp pilus assembly protein PilO